MSEITYGNIDISVVRLLLLTQYPLGGGWIGLRNGLRIDLRGHIVANGFRQNLAAAGQH